jgi:hypothetical protein
MASQKFAHGNLHLKFDLAFPLRCIKPKAFMLTGPKEEEEEKESVLIMKESLRRINPTSCMFYISICKVNTIVSVVCEK